jgi:hypothetical protein
VEPVDRLGRDSHGRVEAEGVVGRREVVVDRLGNADHGNGVLVVESGSDAEGVLSADRDERVEPVEVPQYALDPAVALVRIGSRRAEDRSAAGQDARDRSRVEWLERRFDQPPPPLANADHLVPAVE